MSLGGDTETQKAVGSHVPRQGPSIEPKATTSPCMAAIQPGLIEVAGCPARIISSRSFWQGIKKN